MAKFKISLLTSYAESTSADYLENVICDFNSQIDEYVNNTPSSADDVKTTIINRHYSHGFTFNEKFSMHSNSQRELSFDMLEKQLIHDEWTINPFINILHVGSLLCLTDQYDNQYLFTIKSISIKTTNLNMTYSYTCQDAFTYQLIRQNSGYTIENNSEDDDFIGAKDVDWWVVNKVEPECYLTYNYVPLEMGLYLDENGTLSTYNASDSLYNAAKIIKEPYSKTEQSAYFETFAFTCSSSNGSAALISIGEQVGLALEVKELKRPNSNSYYRYFWYKPAKNPEVTGLSYSPSKNIKDLSFSFNGDSLTTVLNVNSTTDEDENEISIIPEVPGFFQNVINSGDWEKSEYYDGYFQDLLQGENHQGSDDQKSWDDLKITTFTTHTENHTLEKSDSDFGGTEYGTGTIEDLFRIKEDNFYSPFSFDSGTDVTLSGYYGRKPYSSNVFRNSLFYLATDRFIGANTNTLEGFSANDICATHSVYVDSHKHCPAYKLWQDEDFDGATTATEYDGYELPIGLMAFSQINYNGGSYELNSSKDTISIGTEYTNIEIATCSRYNFETDVRTDVPISKPIGYIKDNFTTDQVQIPYLEDSIIYKCPIYFVTALPDNYSGNLVINKFYNFEQCNTNQAYTEYTETEIDSSTVTVTKNTFNIYTGIATQTKEDHYITQWSVKKYQLTFTKSDNTSIIIEAYKFIFMHRLKDDTDSNCYLLTLPTSYNIAGVYRYNYKIATSTYTGIAVLRNSSTTKLYNASFSSTNLPAITPVVNIDLLTAKPSSDTLISSQPNFLVGLGDANTLISDENTTHVAFTLNNTAGNDHYVKANYGNYNDYLMPTLYSLAGTCYFPDCRFGLVFNGVYDSSKNHYVKLQELSTGQHYIDIWAEPDLITDYVSGNSPFYVASTSSIAALSPVCTIYSTYYYLYPLTNKGDTTQQSISLSPYYPYFRLYFDKNNMTEIICRIDAGSFVLDAFNSHLSLMVKETTTEEGVTTEKNYFFYQGDEINNSLLAKTNTKLYLAYQVSSLPSQSATLSLDQYQLYLNYYRKSDEIEEQFAKLADECPWLENKLIDFSYFLRENVISKYEYEQILSSLKNNLRIINGKLLVYSKEYYNALHTKTKILAELTNELDSLGAEFNNTFVSNYANYGTIASDTADFLAAYNSTFQAPTEQEPLFRYEENVGDYFTKYFDSEQRFLKNIYAFKKYFNTINSLSTGDHARLNRDTITLAASTSDSDTTQEQYWITLKPDHYTAISATTPSYNSFTEKPDVPIYYKEKDTFINAELIDASNYTNYYYPSTLRDTLKNVTMNDSGFNLKKNNTYFINETIYKQIFHVDELPEKRETVTQDGTTYVKVTQFEIRNIYLHKHTNEYYIRDEDRYIPFDWIRISPAQFFAVYNTNCNPAYAVKPCKISKSKMWSYFKNGFPMSEIFFYGQKINVSNKTVKNETTSLEESVTTYDRVNEYSLNYNQWNDNTEGSVTYQKGTNPNNYFEFQAIPIVSGSSINIADTYGLNDTDSATDDQQDQVDDSVDVISYDNIQSANEYLQSTTNSYYAFQRTAALGWTIAGTVLNGFGLLPGLNPMGLGVLGGVVMSIVEFYNESFYSWQTDGRTDRTFTVQKRSNKNKLLHNINSKYISYQQGLSTIYSYGDSWFANYAVSALASQESVSAIREYAELTHGSGSTDYASLYGLTTSSEYSNNDQFKRNKYWQYATYYQYLAATYSFENSFYKMYYTSSEIADCMQYQDETQIYSYSSTFNHFYFKLWAQNKYVNFLGPDDAVNKNDKYILIPIAGNSRDLKDENFQPSDEEDHWIFINPAVEWPHNGTTSLFGRASSYALYPLVNTAVTLNINAIDDSYFNNDTITVSYLFNNILSDLGFHFSTYAADLGSNKKAQSKMPKGSWQVDQTAKLSYPFIYNTENNQAYIVAHVEDFEKGLITSSVIYDTEEYDWYTEPSSSTTLYTIINNQKTNSIDDVKQLLYINPEKYYVNPLTLDSNAQIYSLATDLEFDHKNVEDLLEIQEKDVIEGSTSTDYIYWRRPNEDEDYIPVTATVWFTRTSETTFYKQIKNTDEIDYERIYTYSQLSKAAPYYYLDDKTYTVDNFIDNTTEFEIPLYFYHRKKKNTTDTAYELTSTGPFLHKITFTGSSALGTLEQDGITYHYTMLLTRQELQPISRITNGEFWYRYHNMLDYPKLFEHAAMIETELQTYWDVAYAASKYCRFFLPEYWQISADGETNHFSGKIWNIVYESDSGTQSRIRNISLRNDFIPEVEMVALEENGILTTSLPRYKLTYNTNYKLIGDSTVQQVNARNVQYAADVSALRDNAGFLDVLRWFNYGSSDDTLLHQWTVEEYGTRTYYHRLSGGTYWKDLVGKLSSSTLDYDKYDGLYGMAYYLLKQRYTSRPTETYEELLTQKREYWRNMNKKYPNLFLENTYSYENAVSSENLLQMAQLAFKDMKEPERNYNISLINSKYLDNYYGEELHIGDSIHINAKEYHDQPDDVFSALNQYLFISDLSYTLRSDAQFSITVNTIKYQDKLIQSLAKLIR